MADVFISYSKGDASPFVKKIGDALENAGISCWYMEKDSLSGRYAGVITKAIRKCRVFLVVLNERSNQSADVLNEVSIAFKSKKGILPFRLDDSELSDDLFYYLTSFTTAPAHPSDEKSVQDLVTRIADMLVPSAKIIKSGECGDNVTYELDENGVMTISGKGPMWNSILLGNTLWRYPEDEMISCVRILNGVTSIGDGSFAYSEKLTSVIIPDSVTFIDKGAFSNCMRLARVDIPDSVTSIGNGAFWNCAELTRVHIPDSVKYIGKYAFTSCPKLKSVSVPVEADIRGAFDDTTEVIRRPPKE